MGGRKKTIVRSESNTIPAGGNTTSSSKTKVVTKPGKTKIVTKSAHVNYGSTPSGDTYAQSRFKTVTKNGRTRSSSDMATNESRAKERMRETKKNGTKTNVSYK